MATQNNIIPHPDPRMNWSRFNQAVPFELTIEQEIRIRRLRQRRWPITQLSIIMDPEFIHDDWSRDVILGFLLSAKKFKSWCGLTDVDLHAVIHEFYGEYFVSCEQILRNIAARPEGSDLYANVGEIERQALRWHMTETQRRVCKITAACAYLRQEKIIFALCPRLGPNNDKITVYFPTQKFLKLISRNRVLT